MFLLNANYKHARRHKDDSTEQQGRQEREKQETKTGAGNTNRNTRKGTQMSITNLLCEVSLPSFLFHFSIIILH